MTVVTIDIGIENTKIAWLEQKNDLQLLDAFLFKTPYLSATERDLKHIDLGVFWKQIAARIPLSRLKSSQIGVGLPSSLISTILVSLPKMSLQELSVAAVVEAKRRMIPMSTPEHLFEWDIAGESVSANVNKYAVSVIRTEKVFIQNILDIFKHIGVIPVLIVPSCCAIPALVPKDVWVKDEDVVFIDFGAANLNISICRLGKLVFTRSLGYSLNDIVKDIANQMGIARDELEKVLIEEGIPLVDFDPKNKVAITEEIMRQKYDASRDPASAGSRPMVNPLELRMLWQAHIERIVQELRRSFVFYKEQGEGRRIELIYCLGGGSLLKNLSSILSGLIGGRLQSMPPFSGLKTTKDNIYSEAAGSAATLLNSAVSIALSVYAKNTKVSVVNFLPVELKRKEAAHKRNLISFAAGTLIVIAFIIVDVNILIKQGSLKSSVSKVEDKLSSFKNVKDRIDELSRKKEKLSRQLSRFAEIKQNLNWNILLKKLSLTVPQDVVLSRIIIAKGEALAEAAGEEHPEEEHPEVKVEDKALRIKINARVLADYEKAQEIIENFGVVIGKVGYFAKINISPLDLEEITPSESVAPLQGITLTKSQMREFILDAEVVSINEKK